MLYHTFRKRLFLLLLAGILISLAPGSTCFGDEICLFGNEYEPPKVYLKNGKPAGILVDILRYIDHKTEHSFKIELYPWKTSYKKAEQGSGDIFVATGRSLIMQ